MCRLNSITGCMCDSLAGAAKHSHHQKHLREYREMLADEERENRDAFKASGERAYNRNRDYTNE